MSDTNIVKVEPVTDKESLASSSESLDTAASASELSFCFKGQAFAFVQESLKNLSAYICAICQEISAEPFQTACGHIFCSECISKVGEPSELTACPTCREKDCRPRPDAFTKKMIKGLTVRCPAYKLGCDWEGSLGDVGYHSPNKCNYRPVQCEFCSYSSSTSGAEEPTAAVHLMTCLDVPLTCPAAKCGETVQRKRLPEHIAQCDEMLVPCKYAKLGCTEVLPRRELEQHLSEGASTHQTLSLDKTVQLAEAYTTLCCNLQERGLRLPQSLEAVMCRYWLCPTVQPRLFPPVVFRVGDVAALLAADEDWISDDFCSHLGGYTFYMMVHVNGRTDYAKGKYVSVYVGVRPEANSSLVSWPFVGSFTYSLLNQLENKSHCTRSLSVDAALNWSPHANKQLYPRGYHVFISHKNLKLQPDKNCQYLKDDCLFFRVDKVELATHS